MPKPKIASKVHFPVGIENKYKRLLLAFNREMKKAIRKLLLPEINKSDLLTLYARDSDDNTILNLRGQDEDDEIDVILEGIADEAEEDSETVKRIMRAIGAETLRTTVAKVRRSIGEDFIRPADDFSVDIFANNDPTLNQLVNAWVSENTRLITSIPDQFLDNVARVVNAGFRNGSTIEVIRKDIQKQFKIADDRARLIARDQIAKLSSDVDRRVSLEAGFELYVWVTSQDDRVRDSHKVMNGKVCSWEDPTIYKNNINDKKWRKRSSIGGVEKHIGQDFQCRCSPRVAVVRD